MLIVIFFGIRKGILPPVSGSCMNTKQDVVIKKCKNFSGTLQTKNKQQFDGIDSLQMCEIYCVHMLHCQSFSFNMEKKICELYGVQKNQSGIHSVFSLAWDHFEKVVITVYPHDLTVSLIISVVRCVLYDNNEAKMTK